MRAYRALRALWKKIDGVCREMAAGLGERVFEIEERLARRAPRRRNRGAAECGREETGSG